MRLVNPHLSAQKARSKLFWGIRTKLVASFCSVFVFGLITIESIDIWGVPWLSYRGRWHQESTELFNSLNLIADLKKDRLMHWLEERRDNAHVLANSELVKGSLLTVRGAIADLTRDGYSGAGLWATVRQRESYKRLKESLDNIVASYTVYHRIKIAEARTGRVIMATDESFLGTDISQFSTFREALGGEEILVSPIKPAHDQVALTYSSHYIDEASGETVAVLLMEINPDDIIKPMLHTGEGLGSSGEALLVDQEVRILTSLKHPLPDGTRPRPLEYKFEAEPAVLAASGKESIIESNDYRGEPVLAAYRYIPVTPEWGWGLVVKRDRQESYAPLRKSLSYTFLFTLCGSLLVIGLTHLISNNISRPIRVLSQTAQEVERGNLQARAPMTFSDEVGMLATTFNSMIQHIQDWHHELEQQVDARTLELKARNEQLVTEITDRKQAVAALRESKERYQRIFDTVPVSIWVEDFSQVRAAIDELKARGVTDFPTYLSQHPDFVQQASPMVRILDVNDLAVKMFEAKDKAQLLGPLDKILTPKSFESFSKVLLAIEKDSGYFQMEAVNRTFRGNLIDILVTFTIPSRKAEFSHVLVCILDITDRKQAERALQVSQERFDLAMKGSNDGFWDWPDIHQDGQWWSPRLYELLGYDEGEFQARYSKFKQIMHPEDRAGTLQAIKAQLKDQAPFDAEFRLKTKWGQYRWFRGRAQAIWDDAGNPVRMSGSIQDITDRRWAGAVLQDSEREQRIRNQVSHIFLTAQDEEMYGEVLHVILDAMESSDGVFGYIDENGDLVAPSLTGDVWDQYQMANKSIIFPSDSWGDGTWCLALREKRVFYSNEPSANLPPGHAPIGRHVSLPILYRGVAIGLIAVANKKTDYNQKDIQMLETITDFIAPILHARLEKDRQETARRKAEKEVEAQVRQQAAVARLGQLALSGIDLPRLMDKVVVETAKTLGVELCSLFKLLPDKKVFLLKAGFGLEEGVVDRMTLGVGLKSQAGYTLASSEPVIVADFRSETRFYSELLNQRGVISGMSVIIDDQKAPYGVMGVHTMCQRSFTQDDINFLQAVANVIAEAVERKKAEERVTGSLKEKEMLLKEIHHRVKNNLQIISSLLNLQSRHIDDPLVRDLFKNSQNRVKSMALIHEKLYQSENLARIDFADYIRSLTNYLFRMFGSQSTAIRRRIEVENLYLGVDTAIPCGLIITELVSNSLKYGFPGKQRGEISIKVLPAADNELSLIVKDDGVGFPEDVDFQHTESLGMQLVITLVQQLEGTIALDRSAGTAFSMKFPAAKQE